MSIYRYKNCWKAEVWVDRKRVATKSGFPTKEDAKRWHGQSLLSFEEGAKAPAPKGYSFDELLERFTTLHLPTVSIGTQLRYKLDIDQRIRPYFEYRPLAKIDRLVIETFRSELIGKLSAKSVNNCTDLLKTIFRKGVQWGMLDHNPMEHARKLKLPQVKYQWWDRKEHITGFLAEARRSPYYVGYKLALECGLRLGEILGLSKRDVDLRRCQLHVHRQWLDQSRCYGPTKGRRERFISFDPASGLKEALAEAMLKSPDPEVILLNGNRNRVAGRKFAADHFNLLIERARVPRIRFHDLRHTFASWYMIENDDVWSLKDILGHQDVQTTQRYAHLSGRHRRIPRFSWSGGGLMQQDCFVGLRPPRNDGGDEGGDGAGQGDEGFPQENRERNNSRSFHAPLSESESKTLTMSGRKIGAGHGT